MSDLPPGPFSYMVYGETGNGHMHIIDANGRKIAAVWGKPAEKIALAELIIKARDAAEPPT